LTSQDCVLLVSIWTIRPGVDQWSSTSVCSGGC
jgi:hypothetical protein